MTEKVCKTCELEKPISEFNVDRSNKDGHNIHCRTCTAINKSKDGMKCPECHSRSTMVIDNRPHNNGLIRRRRKCTDCNHRFSTVEIKMTQYELMLIPLQWIEQLRQSKLNTKKVNERILNAEIELKKLLDKC